MSSTMKAVMGETIITHHPELHCRIGGRSCIHSSSRYSVLQFRRPHTTTAHQSLHRIQRTHQPELYRTWYGWVYHSDRRSYPLQRTIPHHTVGSSVPRASLVRVLRPCPSYCTLVYQGWWWEPNPTEVGKGSAHRLSVARLFECYSLKGGKSHPCPRWEVGPHNISIECRAASPPQFTCSFVLHSLVLHHSWHIFSLLFH